MFEPFPDNYVWNLSAGIALAAGGLIGEVDRACRPLRDLETVGEDEATHAFFQSWCAVADGLVELAEADEKRHRHRSAGHKYGRAAVYYQTAERMQARSYQPRETAYRKALGTFARYLELTGQPAERVEIPYGRTSLPGILVRPDRPRPAPCVLFFNGLDSTKEQLYGTGTARELRRRGIATLMVDTPGAGEALRLRGLTATPETEPWAAACIDYLAARPDTDEAMVGMLAWSLGGYYGPRATAFLALAPRITLRGILDRITVPFLVVHGEHDRQIPVRYAHALFNDLVNSPKPELKIFTEREGGVEHCSIDNLPVVRDYICDWIAETVTELTDHPNSEVESTGHEHHLR
jgi:dienelactone hydrolase